jgi:hypothetical protein
MTELKLKKLVNTVAYFSIMFLAVALLLNQVSTGGLFGDVSAILTTIANTLAYIIVAFAAFFYVKTKRNILYMISYILAVVLVILFVILPLFN